eukprot:CAMPEP_0117450548 /NCGR_PEP_ID=MMETSP0759-20121206/8527_1 /TAXON_ID=63605 /ORGANISM="Percolomonas cosmopolitus, Strain WS" /LENGTH=1607 /DNA_ID=CAMNT_0005243077 /DNA_START=8 /DNA_END=4834 /DNA_ORIENTATION=+
MPSLSSPTSSPSHSKSSKKSTRIRVYVRLRPPLSSETDSFLLQNSENGQDHHSSTSGAYHCVQISQSSSCAHPNLVTIQKPYDAPKAFQFDQVFDETSSQAAMFESGARSSVDDIFEGFHNTVFTYGQTGSGKTYTLSGSGDSSLLSSAPTHNSEHGIILRSLYYIFERIESENDLYETKVFMSYIQIYNEKIQDLISPQNDNLALREHEDGVFIQDLSSKQIRTIREAAQLIALGDSNRITALTKMNAQSSRSHSCLMISLERRAKIVSNSNLVNTRSVLKGRLYLVDLCGSERLKKTEATGLRKKEANFINLSLSTLGQVMHALETGKDFVPFRNSKLTRLLQESLSGRGKSSIICCIGPSSEHMQETTSSLLFGSRAMKVKTSAQAFKDVDYKALSIKLQQDLDISQEKSRELEDILDEEMKESERLERKLVRKTEKLQQSKNRIQQLMSAREDDLGQLETEYEENLAELEAQIEEKDNDIEQLKDACEQMKSEQGRLLQANEESERIIQSLKEENEQHQERVEFFKDETDQLMIAMEQKQADLEEYMEYSEQKIAAQDKKIEKKKSKIALLKEHINDIERHKNDELRMYSAQIAKLTKQVENQKDELKDLDNVKRQLDTRENEFRITQSALEEARSSIEKAHAEKDEIYANITSFQQKLMTAESELEQRKVALQETVSQLHSTKEEADKFKEETTKKDSLLQDMNEKIRQAQQELDTTVAELRINSEKLTRQESSAAKAHTQNTLLEKQLMTIETKMRSVEIALEKSRKQNSCLVDDIEKERARCVAFQTALSREKSAKNDVIEQLSNVQQRFDQSHNETYQAHRDNERLSTLLTRYENQMSRMQQQLHRAVRNDTTLSTNPNPDKQDHDETEYHLQHDPIEEQIRRQNQMRLNLIKEKFEKNESKHLELLHAAHQERIRKMIQQKEGTLRELLESDSHLSDDTKRQMLQKHREEVESLQSTQQHASKEQLQIASNNLKAKLTQELKECEIVSHKKTEEYRKLRQQYEDRLSLIARSSQFEHFQQRTQHDTQSKLLALHEEKNAQFESIISNCSKADPSSLEVQIAECKELYAKKQEDLQESMDAKLELYLREEKKKLTDEFLQDIRNLDESLTAFSEGAMELEHLSEESVLPSVSVTSDITDQLSSTIASLTERLHVVEKELSHTEQKYIQATIEKAEFESKIHQINSTLELVRQSSQNLEESTAASVVNLYTALRNISQLDSKMACVEPIEFLKLLTSFEQQCFQCAETEVVEGHDLNSHDDDKVQNVDTILQQSGLLDLELPKSQRDDAQKFLSFLHLKYEKKMHDRSNLKEVASRIVELPSVDTQQQYNDLTDLSNLFPAQDGISSSIVSTVDGLTFDGLMNFVWKGADSMECASEQESFSAIVHRLCQEYVKNKVLMRRALYMYRREKLKLHRERQNVRFLQSVAEHTTQYLLETLHEKQTNLVECAEELSRVNDTLIEVKREKERERAALLLQSCFRRIKSERVLRAQKEETEKIVRENILKRKYIDALKRSRNELKQKRDEYKTSLNEHSSKTGALLIKQSLLDVSAFFAECSNSLMGSSNVNTSPRAGSLRRADSFQIGRSRTTSNASTSSVESF